MASNLDLGTRGEELAAEYLIGKGFAVIGRNVRYKTGEIDIIAKNREGLHFVEVKTRRSSGFMEPFEAVTSKKISNIKKTAEVYLMDSKNGFDENKPPACHFDVISIDFSDGRPQIECILDAFE